MTTREHLDLPIFIFLVLFCLGICTEGNQIFLASTSQIDASQNVSGYIKTVHAESRLECAASCVSLLNGNSGICEKAYLTNPTGNDKYGQCKLFSPCTNGNELSEIDIEANVPLLTYYKDVSLPGMTYSVVVQLFEIVVENVRKHDQHFSIIFQNMC